MNISFIGAGSMAEAMISGIIEKKIAAGNEITVLNRSNGHRITQLQEKYGIKKLTSLSELEKHTDVIILAVKPKDILTALQSIQSYIQQGQLLVSVAAGISLSFIESQLHNDVPIVRAMPNTSAMIGKSATAIAFNQSVSDAHQKMALKLFSAIGLTKVVEENQLDAVTGLSGSGPAYIYYIAEALEQAANEIGLEEQIAKQLVIQTLIGAAEMLKHSGEAPENLRKAVTSPGGTTEAGIKVLEQHSVKETFIDCVKAATKQSAVLAQTFEQVSSK